MTRNSTINWIVFSMLPWFGISPDKTIILITRLFWIVTIAFIGYCDYLVFDAFKFAEFFQFSGLLMQLLSTRKNNR